MRQKQAGFRGACRCCGVVLACLLSGRTAARALPLPERTAAVEPAAEPESAPVPASAEFLYEGLVVRRVEFADVAAERLQSLRETFPLSVGMTLSREAVRQSLRRVYASGLYETVQVDAEREDNGVALVFHGQPSRFLGMISVEGARGGALNAQLQRATQMAAGARFTQSGLKLAIERMKSTLADNGFHEATITYVLAPMPAEQLVDVALHVDPGPQARIGEVTIHGESGLTAEQFRRNAHLREGAHEDHESTQRALDGVLKHYRKSNHLEAELKLDARNYDPSKDRINYEFTANRGPLVRVLVTGAKIGVDKARKEIPLFEEGAVDEDLLNEGDRRLRDYYQRLGFFDVKVSHEQHSADPHVLTILYRVQTGARRRILSVTVEGNRYFDSATLRERLGVQAAGGFEHHGLYNQALVATDIHSLQALYQNNGFSRVKINAETRPIAENPAHMPANPNEGAPLAVIYRIDEGPQQRVRSVRIDGADHADLPHLFLQMNTAEGQLFSPQNLAGDRDAILNDYVRRGFESVRVEITQQPSPQDENLVDVVFHVREGQQIFVRKVVLRGLEATRPRTVEKAVVLRPGDPLNQAALADTQRNLYEFALFNEVDTAIENPNGDEPFKTVLVQAAEARRWALTYGGGFEGQIGTPQNNCAGAKERGISCTQKTYQAINPRFLVDITRNNLFGREQSASLRGTYGFLEEKVDLLYQVPHFEGARNLAMTASGGYASSLDVSTYVATKLEGGVRFSQHFQASTRTLRGSNTLIYEFNFRRVKVDANNLQVAQSEITPLSTAQRVAGPALTWIRDTRDSPLDAHRGAYTSVQEFLSAAQFGAQVEFHRLDLSNSSYHSFDKGRFVLARNTRYGQERAFGNGSERLIPLPERLYAGGATSLRGFGLNAAGPRDPETGFPVGGAGTLLNSTELRLPPPTLPGVGNSVSVVLFHDMGNVFTNASDAWTSLTRFNQPNRDACKNLSSLPSTTPWSSTGLIGACNFNYFTHAPGAGLRYHTPIGPIRFDYSYNVNPPIYPVLIDYSNLNAPAYYRGATHNNFFFSLGQTF